MGFEHWQPEKLDAVRAKAKEARMLKIADMPHEDKPIPKHCKRGHVLDDKNLYVAYRERSSKVTGKTYLKREWKCRACVRLASLELKYRKRRMGLWGLMKCPVKNTLS